MHNPPIPRILLATLGATWQVMPEIVAFLAADKCPLYAHHNQPKALQEAARACRLASIDELWVITSSGEKTIAGIDAIQQWSAGLTQPLVLRIFIAKDTNEVTTPQELEILRELIFRAVLYANECGRVVCSLAGGRKTMSADLQRAASLFGALGLLHIVAPDPLPAELKNYSPEFWQTPLPEAVASQLLPAFIGSYQRRESMDAVADANERISSENYPLPVAATKCVFFQLDGKSLVNSAELRERDAQQLLSNYLAEIAQNERHANWRHLYRLKPASIARLRNESVNASHQALIRSLPKAELHCHLGGILTLEQQITVAQSIWDGLTAVRQTALRNRIMPLLNADEWDWNWPQDYLRVHTCAVERAEIASALLTQAKRAQLDFNLYQSTMPRVALKKSAHGFSAYERSGELSGSAVLGHPAALQPYIQGIQHYATVENIRYLELRGSPHKYAVDNPVDWLKHFAEQLQDSAATTFRFIWIIDRRQANAKEIIAQAVAAKKTHVIDRFLVGLDLAGDEASSDPDSLTEDFMPALRECLPITIHAGEGEPAENIWQAVYRLNADRIGHGLTLADHPELLKRFRNRDISLELCPSSNQQVIGYADPDNTATHDLPCYPIAQLWRSGVALTINTDNPGISRTNLTQEYLLAARLSAEPFTLWDVLAMIKQGFVQAMADTAVREQLLKVNDKEIFRIMSHWLDPEECDR